MSLEELQPHELMQKVASFFESLMISYRVVGSMASMAYGEPRLTIDIDMAKARNIHLERIRIKRNAELSKLDVQATKAQDIGDAVTLTQIRARKQELRDLPATLAPTLASAASVDALKAIQPLE